ncbi:MAG: hypothetical protein J6K21_05625 [Bacilli bacterium]|nr:hypothetical protein [Bacilli bacterium]
MIRTDKKYKDYKLIEYADILIGMSVATKLNNKNMTEILSDLFNNMEVDSILIDKHNYVRINKNSKIIKFLIEEANIIDYDTYIDHDILKDALSRAYFEFNYEMKNKLSIYFRKYVENEIEGIDNTIIKEEIKNDRDLLEYIKKYDNFTMYIEDKVNKNIEIKEKLNVKRYTV